MSRSRLLLILLTLVALLGCRQGPHVTAQIELMNAEKRALEDELYALEFDLEESLRQVDKLKKENERLRSGSGPRSPRRDSGATNRDLPEKNVREGELAPPAIDEGMLVEPQVEIPDSPPKGGLSSPPSSPAPTPAAEAPPPASPLPAKKEPVPAPAPSPEPAASPATPPAAPSARSAAPLPPPVRQGGSALKPSPKPSTGSTFVPKSRSTAPKNSEVFTTTPSGAPSLETSDPRVTHLYLNEHHTGGIDLDRQPGDDGIAVVLEPRNAAGAFVPLAGPLSILVLDPSKQANEGRVLARWEVDANEAQRSLENSTAIRGIHLRLPWPSGVPQTGRLRLYVRYLTVDNRDLRVDREIFLTLPGQVTQTWTPRATPRSGAAALLAQPQPVPIESTPVEPTEPSPVPLETPSGTTQMASPEWRPYR